MKSDKIAAGILVYRINKKKLEVLLARPGGPWYDTRKDPVWTIPKGENNAGEILFATAKREFSEETGLALPKGSYPYLGAIRQRDGKVVHAWACRKSFDLSKGFKSNTFHLEWPEKSGQTQEFPEISDVKYFSVEAARLNIHPSQLYLLNNLISRIHKTI